MLRWARPHEKWLSPQDVNVPALWQNWPLACSVSLDAGSSSELDICALLAGMELPGVGSAAVFLRVLVCFGFSALHFATRARVRGNTHIALMRLCRLGQAELLAPLASHIAQSE